MRFNNEVCIIVWNLYVEYTIFIQKPDGDS
jgi:hypothetical protein